MNFFQAIFRAPMAAAHLQMFLEITGKFSLTYAAPLRRGKRDASPLG